MYNKVILVGFLGGEPEQRFYADGNPAAVTFNLATDRTWTGNDGEKKKETVWFTVSAWGKLGENCVKYLHKGSKVLVEGRVDNPYAYAKDGGEIRAINQVSAEVVKFMESKPTDKQDEALF